MKYGIRGLVTLLSLVCFSAPMVRAEDVDLSTPKKAGVAFAKAVATGDMATAKAISTGTEAEYGLVKTISDLAVSMKKMGDASEKKFGADGKLPKEMAMDIVGEFENADEKIEGDTATLIMKDKADDKFPPTLKKDGGKWKVDLSNLSKDPGTAMMSQAVPPMIKAMDTVTKNINDGKYKTPAEAFADLGAQLTGPGPGAPTEPPK